MKRTFTYFFILVFLFSILLVESSFASEMNVKPIKVVLDPGHGGRDPGAIGVNGIYEKDVNFDIALRVRDLLVQAGFDVVMTREFDSLLREYTKSSEKAYDLQARVDVATTNKADLFVSIHANSFSPNFQGTMVLYYDSNNRSERYPSSLEMNLLSSENKKLALSILNSITSHVGTQNLGVLPSNVYVVRSGTVPSVLIETAFLSNIEEAEKLASPEFRQAMAEAIFHGIKDYQPPKFIDIINHWAKNFILELSKKGIIVGYHDRFFRPDQGLTRAELIALLNRTGAFEGQEVKNEHPNLFFDVAEDHWAYELIYKAAQMEVAKGYLDGTFRPEQMITREEMSGLLYRLYFSADKQNPIDQINEDQNGSITDEVYKSNHETLTSSSNEGLIIPFEDVPRDHWAMNAIMTLKQTGIIKGVNEVSFGVGRIMTRAEAVTLLFRVKEHQTNTTE